MGEDRIRAALVCEQLLQPVPGGIGSYVRAMMRYLPPLGVEVEPVVAWHPAEELADAGLAHARRLKVPRQGLYARWSKNGRPTVNVPDGGLVHAPSLAFPTRGGRPLVVTVHDVLFRDYPDAYPKRGVEFHERALQRIGEADMVIVPSDATAGALAALDEPPSTVRVVPMGTDLTPPDDPERDALLDALDVQRPYILWVGTVEPRKNPEGVVRGFVHAIESGVPDADSLNLYLVGPPGWWSGDLADFIESKSLAERVRRLGYQRPAVLAALYAGCEAFVFPSLAEGFGLPVVEAMACGAPVVCSSTTSMPEVAGSAALLCDPADPRTIGSSLAKLLRDRELADDLRRLGRQRASEFSWANTARRTVACYREVLDR